MALFKQFHGTETELNTQVPIQEGRNYFLTNNGKMFIDTANERICLNAEEADVAGALKNGDEELTAANISNPSSFQSTREQIYSIDEYSSSTIITLYILIPQRDLSAHSFTAFHII